MSVWRVVVQPRLPVHVHPIELVRAEARDAERPPPRPKTWIAVLYRDERRAFDSRSVSIELHTERGARWLAHLVRAALVANVLAPSNAAATHRAPIVWERDRPGRDDDCACEHGSLGARVEMHEGHPRIGVYRRGTPSVTLLDSRALAHDVVARSGEAGRFLAELALDLATAGVAIPSIAEPIL